MVKPKKLIYENKQQDLYTEDMEQTKCGCEEEKTESC